MSACFLGAHSADCSFSGSIWQWVLKAISTVYWGDKHGGFVGTKYLLTTASIVYPFSQDVVAESFFNMIELKVCTIELLKPLKPACMNKSERKSNPSAFQHLHLNWNQPSQNFRFRVTWGVLYWLLLGFILMKSLHRSNMTVTRTKCNNSRVYRAGTFISQVGHRL